MFSIIYIEEKVVTRNAFELMIEKQEDCKVIYSNGCITDFCDNIKTVTTIPDLCIIADTYNYCDILTIIKT